ncbi:MAG: cytochrome [Gammaproteobacteria bacterium]|nr:cytochrome [Gammaproteobacteria bacterium]
MTLALMHQNEVSGAPRDRYTRVAIVLHWAIAAFIVFNLCIGFFMESWPPPIRFMALMLHVSSGLTVLALTVARVVWRLLNNPPPYPAGMKRWEGHTAHFAHFLLYAAMVLMPLTGWAILSAHSPPGSRGAAVEFAVRPGMPPGVKPGAAPPRAMPALPPGGPPPLKMWNLVPMPMIAPIEAIGEEPGGVAPQHRLHDEFVEWHSVGGYLLLGLLILHIVGALKHQFIDRQSEFARMGIGRRRQS